MRKHLIRNVVACDPSVSISTLERAPRKATVMADGIERDPLVYEVLAPIGMTIEELHEVRAHATRVMVARAAVKASAPPNIQAMEACERFLSGGSFEAARGQLGLRFPDQLAFVFEGLGSQAKGTEAAIMVAHLVARCRDLESGVDRKATRVEDREALAAMAKAGLTPEKLDELEVTVKTAMTEVDPLANPDVTSEARAAERLDTLRRIHTWVTIWSGLIRGTVKRRDQLIRLGLATRRPRKKKVAPTTVVMPVAVATGPLVEDTGPDSRAA